MGIIPRGRFLCIENSRINPLAHRNAFDFHFANAYIPVKRFAGFSYSITILINVHDSFIEMLLT